MEWLFSWEVTSVVFVAIAGTGLTLIGMEEFKAARACFLIAAADATGGMVMWGLKSERSTFQVAIIAFVLLGSVGAALIFSLRYLDEKEGLKIRASGNLSCEVVAMSLEPVYRFFQEPPVYFQRLDTMLRVSLTNHTGKPLYVRDYSVQALVGTDWIQFKNADSAAFEPYAFGIMSPMAEGNPFIKRFDLSKNGFDYIMRNKPITPDENLELWMFFVSGIKRQSQGNISQFKFVFYDATNKELPCACSYSVKSDKGSVVGTSVGDITALATEPVPPNLREEPAH